MSTYKHYDTIIIGSGLSALTSAYFLAKNTKQKIMIIEKLSYTGGLAYSINKNGFRYDLGSHRLHFQENSRVGKFIKEIAGEYLLHKDRGGQLYIKGKYTQYPLHAPDLIWKLGIVESTHCFLSLLKARIQNLFLKKRKQPMNYESYLLKSAGKRAYEIFYKPYALKVWKVDPKEISTTAIKKRLSMTSPLLFLKDFLTYPFKSFRKKGTYSYLEGGIGTLARILTEKLQSMGITFELEVEDFQIEENSGSMLFHYYRNNKKATIRAEKIISTIPLGILVEKLRQEAKPPKLKLNGLKLIFIHISGEPLISGETLYFPEIDYCFGRVSFPKRFSSSSQQSDKLTAIICEVPISNDPEVITISDQDLIKQCFQDLIKVRAIHQSQVQEEFNFVLKLPHVYPIYKCGWEEDARKNLEALTEKHPNLFSSGRQGLFLHCNIDHVMDIGIDLADHITHNLSANEWNRQFLSYHQTMKLRD